MQVTPMSQIVDVVAESYVQCVTLRGPVTVIQPDGTRVTEEESVSFTVGVGGQYSIADQEGQVLYEKVQLVDGCPQAEVVDEAIMDEGIVLDEGMMLDGYAMDPFGTPLPGGGVAPPPGSSAFGGGSAGAGGAGGAAGAGGAGAGLGGLAALAGVGAVIAATNDDNNRAPSIASPAFPAP